MLRDREVERIARGVDDPQRCAEDLVNAAVEAGGEDNVTVVVLDIVDVDTGAAPSPDALVAPDATGAAIDDQEVEASPDAANDDTDDEGAPPVARAAPRQSRRRRATGIALVVIPVLFIAAVALGAIAWYDRHNYYLAAVDGDVVLYKGRPDALLWDPSRLSSPDLRVSDLTPQGRSNVRDHISFDTKGAALSYLRGVTTTTTTSTTVARTTTTTVRRAPRATTGVPGP
jgi:protein phosphatase